MTSADTKTPPLPAAVQAFTKLRGLGGFMARGAVPAGYLASARQAGANHLRCWYTARWDGSRYVIAASERAVMSGAMPHAARLGIGVVIAIAVADHTHMPWGDPHRAAAYVALVAEVAGWHRGHSAVLAVDMLNEPETREPQAYPGAWSEQQFQQVHDDWRALATSCAVALHAAVPRMLAVYQVGLHGDPNNFAESAPIALPWVVHSAHVYHPHSFSHQNVQRISAGQPPAPWVGYSEAHRDHLQASLNVMVDWSDRHGLPIYVGETGAVQKAPGAAAHAQQVTDVCVMRRWPFAHHEWRGWPGWHPIPETLAVLQAAFKK